MSFKVNCSFSYGTHLPGLIKAMSKTTGDVLELGMGVFSTPYLHYQCILSNRKLVSYENYKNWMQKFLDSEYDCENHEINFVEKYSDAKIEKGWSVALVDQTPDSSRTEEIRRLANYAEYIVIHDAAERHTHIYHYDTIYPLFKYRTDWDEESNPAVVLSNFHDLKDFWK